MLVSAIIAKGRSLADVTNATFYTDAEALFDTQLAWEQVYAFLASNNDDYFIEQSYIDMSSAQEVTTDTERDSVRYIDTTSWTFGEFEAGFYRLRLIQYQGLGGTAQFYPVQKMTIENFGNTQNTPAYRFMGKKIAIYDPANYEKYCIWWYPRPETLTLTTDLSYPYNMIPEIMAYQVAAEIRRKQKSDTKPWVDKAAELYQTMQQSMSRDDSHAEPIKNVFGQGFAPYI